ncbi:WAS/WASL-interacting protein family member [Spatholobus suberectus]|nr:WAS/WASL-interacting protein family member [Spatholobus suberectus]
MCSNTCNSACGCGTGGNVVSSIWSSSLKKQQKRPRVPKRGPGVAELEKILREQESIDTTDKGNQEGFSSFISHHSNSNSNSYPSSSFKFHPPQPPTSQKITVPLPSSVSSNLPNNVPSAPIFDHLGPTTLPTITSIYGNCGSLERSSGSGLVSPEKELFPLNLNSCKSKSNMNESIDGNQHDSARSPSRNLSNESNHVWPYSGTIQKRNNQYSSPTANQFRGTPTSSGSLSIGLHNHLELPSNQNSYYNYTSRVPEEHKMVGMKRSHSSTLENSLIPPSNFHVLPSFSHYNRPHQSSINDSHGASSFSSTKECYRDAKWGSTLELSNARFNSDTAVPGHANFPPFVTPEVPSPPMHLFPGVLTKGNVLPCQVTEDKMDSHRQSESSEPNHRPFYDFLEVEDSEGTETMRGANRGGREAGKVGIDLNLKL